MVSRCALVGLAQECGLSLPTGGEARDFWQLPSDDECDPLLQDEALRMRFTRHCD